MDDGLQIFLQIMAWVVWFIMGRVVKGREVARACDLGMLLTVSGRDFLVVEDAIDDDHYKLIIKYRRRIWDEEALCAEK